MKTLKLRFSKELLHKYSNQYEYSSKIDVREMISSIKKKKYLDKAELINICAWKTPRSKNRVKANDEDYIKEITSIALTTKSDQLSIEILTLLNGVGWPTASTILHFFHNSKYPILDFRALYSLGLDKPPTKYNYTFWEAYTDYCRKLSSELNLDMRSIDRGLWQYSKDNQSDIKKE